MEEYHKLLKRQMRKYLSKDTDIDALVPLLNAVNEAYKENDQDRLMIERSLELSSAELFEMLEKLKETQVQLIQKEKMAGIGLLAAGIAHEINNPLGYIISNIDTLQKYIDKYLKLFQILKDAKNVDYGNLSGECKEIFKKIDHYERENNMQFVTEDSSEIIEDSLEGLNRISKIVEGLRDFSRINVKECFSSYDLNDGVKNTLMITNNTIKHLANIKLELANLPMIHAIGSEINQVILNLVLNAAQAIKETNKIGIIKISTYEKENYIVLEIEDNGIGIKEENLTSIFNPFFSTKPIGEGTGLGLSISYDIVVNKHKGKLDVISEVGKGTTFIIQIPSNYKADKKSGERMCFGNE